MPRRGVDVTPPRIDRLTPTPGIWIVDNIGVPEIQIGFTEAVTVPAGAISAWTVGSGAISNFTTSYDGVTNILTVSFASPIRDDRLTIVVDYSVTDSAGNELDGEIADPLSAVLPSGDGVRGGQAVFRFNILQGDANRDGTVDTADAAIIVATLGLCNNDAGFDPRADFTLDGCVNAQDVAIFKLQTEGKSLPATDGTPPIVTAIREPGNGLLGSFDRIVIDFNEIVSDLRINERTCFLVDGSNNLIVPTSGVGGPFGTTAVYNFAVPLPQCGTYTINISNALADQSGELLVVPSTPPVVTGLIPPPAPVLNTHTTMTTGASVTITGSAPGATSVEVSAPALPMGDPMRLFTVPLTNNAFSANVGLAADQANDVFFTALSTCNGVRSSPVMTTVTHDTQPPEIFIDFPTDGAQITTDTTDVAGRVGDMLSGFMGLTVTVNGNPAIVDVGIGNNGTFFLQNVPLGAINQPTIITAAATDILDNTVSKQITVTRVAISANTSQMVALPPADPNDRKSPVLTPLPAPIAVQMTDTDGTPFANKLVTFKVTRSDGRLSSAPGFTCIGDGSMILQCHTDSSGQAKAMWTMGHDAGCGNNRVEVTSTSVEGTVAFCASALAATASQLNIGSGNNQRAEAGGPAPQPLRVWVSDGQNGVAGQAVLFTVTTGGGLVNGQPTATVTTDITGHAGVNFTLGPDWGNNVVEATLVVDPNPTMPQVARFVTFGVVRDEATPTSFMGVVLNNASQPIGGATCTLTVGGQTLTAMPSDVAGRFTFDQNAMGMSQTIPAGAAHLFIDGGTATTVNGQPVSLGTYPTLPFNTVIIPNAANTLPTPVLLPSIQLQPPNDSCGKFIFDATSDVTLTLQRADPNDPTQCVAAIDGLVMLIRAGTTVTKADGTVVDALNPITLRLSQVHADDIPMPIPDGASPPFAWTLQPSGTTFNPPIEITYPNMSGLPAGSVAYFLSFDHATSRFEIVATGHVTDDGSQILSDSGAGLTVAGWGCNCPPYSVTGDCCSGCNDACCEGSCCCVVDTLVCCDGPCCNGACCSPDQTCCGGVCCDGTCNNGICCDGPTCGGQCCSGSTSCCGGECCEGECCNGVCCPKGGSCCDGKCCEGLCCNGMCCDSGDQSCCNGQCCAGACCETTGVCCPAGSESCCNDTCCDGPCCNGNCCASGNSCCGDLCCGPGETCCGGLCCTAGQTCLNGVCCDGPNCGGQCCPPGSESCCNNACCDGPCCNDVCCAAGGECCGVAGCCPVGQTCCGDAGCCPTGSLCCAASGGGCCPQNTKCCGEACCGVGISCCDGACCPAGQDCCGGDTCCESDKCCGDTCCQANETCCNGVCALGNCSFPIPVPPGEGCPGSTVVLTLTADCDPDCDTMSFSLNSSVQYLTVNLPGSISCIGPAQQLTFTVDIALDAPAGPITFPIIGTTDAAQCSTSVTVTVKNVDLIFDGLTEDKEESPGGLICVNNDDDDNSVRADKDDDPGAILNENDLKTLVLSLNGLDPSGSGTLKITQSSGGMVRLYDNADRSGLVTASPSAPLIILGSQLPRTLYVEGLQASSAPRDITVEFEYTIPGGDTCKDKVKISVAGIELIGTTEFTGEIHRTHDLVELSDAYPTVAFDPLNTLVLPSSGVPALGVVRGRVADLIAPLKNGDLTVNGVPAVLTVDSTSQPYGPFVQNFEANVMLNDYDQLIRVDGRNALGNIGTDKIVITAVFDSKSGDFQTRANWEVSSTPTGIVNHLFRLEARDALAQGTSLTAILDTGVGFPKAIPLIRLGGIFLSNPLCLVPETADFTDAPPEVIETRIKARLGTEVRVTFVASDGSTCEDQAIVVGTMLVDAVAQAPLDVIRAGLARDVVHNTTDNNVLAVVGAPGDLPSLPQDNGVPYLTGTLTPYTYQDQVSSLSPASTRLLRITQDPTQPDYNLFRTGASTPILPLASKTAMWSTTTNHTLVDVEAGGFLRLEVPTGVGLFQSVEAVRGEMVVAVLIDGLGAGFPRNSFPPKLPPDNLETFMANGLLPNFKKLINDANSTRIRYDGHTTFPSITYSAWSSWVTGQDPKDHGVTGSNFYRRSAPSTDPFWCGANPDPNCDLGMLGGGMMDPIDMVVFLDPLDGIFDLDVANVWSSIGTLNSAIRPRTQDASSVSTIYERLNDTGLLSAVVYHFPFRGATSTSLPSAFEGLEQHADKSGRKLDLGTSQQLDELMGLFAPTHIRPPQLLTAYYAGFDTHIHNDPAYPSGGFATSHLAYTDKHVGTLIRILDQWNLLDDAVFTFTGDHGLSRVAKDDQHSMLQEEWAIVNGIPVVLLDQELDEIIESAGFDPLDFRAETSHDAVLAINGGMAHIYVKNRDPAVNSWSALPRYMEDVLVMAERFYDNNTGVLHDDPDNNYVGAFDLILVRNPAGGFNGPYEVLVKQGGVFSTISLSQAVSDGMVDSRYVNFEANIQRLQNVRSGDIILLSAGMCNNDATAYYFGQPLPGWHGSLCPSDMTIPIIFSFPRGTGAALTRFENIVDDPIVGLPQAPAEARITDIEPIIDALLTLETP